MSKKRKYTDMVMAPREFSLDVIKAATKGRAINAVNRKDSTSMLRGGSVGAIIDGEVYGVCQRKAYLRYNGIDAPLDSEIELMTSQGEQNEEIWLADLRAGLEGTDIEVLDQESFDCLWKGVDGKDGSGSPDVLLRKDGKPIRALELKNISGIGKVKSTHYELIPDSTHLIQAANYSIRMGDMYLDGTPLDYDLVYSSRSLWHIFAMSDKVKKIIVDKGWDVQYNFGRPMSVRPFHRVYNLKWIDGKLAYWTDGLKKPVYTELTRESIDEYYRLVSTGIDETGDLGPVPITKDLRKKSTYSQCNYCDYASVCETGENLTPQEFKDQSQVLAQAKKDVRIEETTIDPLED